MPHEQLIDDLGGWQGYAARVACITHPEPGETYGEVWIELRPDSTTATCSGCGQPCDRRHDSDERWFRDLPIWGRPTWLLIDVRRVKCPACGPRVERIDFLSPHARVTKRLAAEVARLADELPLIHVAAYFSLHWKTVKVLHKNALRESLPEPDWDRITVLAMDEFAVQKGHRYATVIIDPTRRQVLWVGRDRSREAVRSFFEARGAAWCGRLAAVAMDMTAAYASEVRAHCPQAEVVYDLFHVVAKYGREVVDRVRVDEANRLADNVIGRKLVKGARWLLLGNEENLKPDQRVRLWDLLEANVGLAVVYILKDDLKRLWRFTDRAAAQCFWDDWRRRALESGLKPLRRFVERLTPYLGGIMAHCDHPLHTSVLEGINNTIKVIKRRAYGYRDDSYFFLQIRANFPGKG